jgi:small subunit ribosomal protein S7
MRRRRAEKRETGADLKYGSPLVSHVDQQDHESGKKLHRRAHCLWRAGADAAAGQPAWSRLISWTRLSTTPARKLEVKSRRVGGATYQVPSKSPPTANGLAMRWLVTYARPARVCRCSARSPSELMDAFKNTGNAIKKRDDTHKMAQANKAFAHYRW